MWDVEKCFVKSTVLFDCWFEFELIIDVFKIISDVVIIGYIFLMSLNAVDHNAAVFLASKDYLQLIMTKNMKFLVKKMLMYVVFQLVCQMSNFIHVCTECYHSITSKLCNSKVLGSDHSSPYNSESFQLLYLCNSL